MRAIVCTVLAGTCALGPTVSVPAQSPSLVRDINPTGDSDPQYITDVAGMTFFTAFHPATGRELWRTDGTAAGTVLVLDIAPGPVSARPEHLASFGGWLLFTADDGSRGRELWLSDGSAAGTRLVEDIWPGPMHSRFFAIGIFDGRYWFAADDGVHGRELWCTDGTAAGTRMVADINPGPPRSDPYGRGVFKGEMYFAAIVPGFNVELCKTDGTAAGTVMVADIAPGPTPSFPVDFAELGGELFFTAVLNPSGLSFNSELMKTDGTAAGTAQVVDINGDPSSGSSVSSLHVFQQQLVFLADDGVAGREVWVSDGTAAGTHLLADTQRGPQEPSSVEFGIVDAGLIFVADTTWWYSDGTPAGTRPYDAKALSSLIQLGSRRIAGRDIFGQVWTNDGRRSYQVSIWSLGRSTGQALSAGWLFLVQDIAVGLELYVWRPGATSQKVGHGCGQNRSGPTLRASDPVLGTTMTISGSARPGTTAVVLLGDVPPAPLRLIPGCWIFVDLANVIPLPPLVAGPSWSTAIAIPDNPELLELRLALQAVVIPSTQLYGMDLSNGVHITPSY